MSILTANLKHLYQRRALWLIYLVFGFFVWISVYVSVFDTEEPEEGAGKFIGLMALEFLAGLVAAVMQMEILTKSFAFCLPGHRLMVRKFIFLIAVVTNLAGSLLFLFYPGLSPAERALVLCSAFCAGMVFYVAGVWLAFGTKQPLAFLGFMVFAMFFSKLVDLHRLLESAIVHNPVVVVLLGLLCGAALWIRLGRPDLARRSCLRPWIGFESFNYQKVRDTRSRFSAERWKKLKGHPRPWVESLFLGCIERCRRWSMAQYAWGSLYSSFGLLLSCWPKVLLLVLFWALFLGYTGPRMWTLLVFVPMALVWNAKPAVFSSMLAVGGRKERFYSTLMTAVAASVLLVLLVVIVIAVSALVSSYIPDINYRALTLSYQTVTAKCLYVPLIFLPVAGILHLVFYRKPVLMIVVSIAIAYLVVMGGIMSRAERPVIHSFQAAVTVGSVAWLIFILVLRHICARRCLAK
jgi:hypothetical protein